MVWERAAGQQFDILSDPGAEVIRSYGLLHLSGHRGNDIAIRTAVLIDKDGRERWRRVSDTITDVPGSEEVLEQVRKLASK